MAVDLSKDVIDLMTGEALLFDEERHKITGEIVKPGKKRTIQDVIVFALVSDKIDPATGRKVDDRDKMFKAFELALDVKHGNKFNMVFRREEEDLILEKSGDIFGTMIFGQIRCALDGKPIILDFDPEISGTPLEGIKKLPEDEHYAINPFAHR